MCKYYCFHYRKLNILLLFLSIFCIPCSAQSDRCGDLLTKANLFIKSKDYHSAAALYDSVFQLKNIKIGQTDRYNAACVWAITGQFKKSFRQLHKLVFTYHYHNYDEILADPDLNNLHLYAEWRTLLNQVKANNERQRSKLNKYLVAQLDTIRKEDQVYRRLQIEANKQFGVHSLASDSIGRLMSIADSINIIKVQHILDKYGWPREEVLGKEGCTTLFLVLQHTKVDIQEKYLPMVKKAVKRREFSPINFALFCDRIDVNKGRPQTYGSQCQIIGDSVVFDPIKDEKNVDRRRKKIGLEPIAQYRKIIKKIYIDTL